MRIFNKLLLSPNAGDGGQGTAVQGNGAGNDDGNGQDNQQDYPGGDVFDDDSSSGSDGGSNAATGNNGQGQAGGTGTNPQGGIGADDNGGQGSGQGASGNTGGATPATTFSADDVAKILAAAGVQNRPQDGGVGGQGGQGNVGGQGNQGQGGQPQQMTPEEFARVFNVYSPSSDVLAGLRAEDPKVQLAAFTSMRDGLMKQALTMAEYRFRQQQEQFVTEQFQPVAEYVRSNQEQQLRDNFFKANSDLKPYETMVDAVAQGLAAKGVRFNSVKEAQTRYAAEVRTMLKQAGINLTGGAGAGSGTNAQAAGQNTGGQGGNQNGNQTRSQRKMSTLMGGGQPSGGRSTGGSGGPPGIEVFD